MHFFTRFSRFATLLFVALHLAMPVQAEESVSNHIAITMPFVRATPPMLPNSAAFMSIANHDAIDHSVVSASSDISEVVELHTHIHEGGMMRMRRIDQITIPANDRTQLKPGGLHIMLIGLKQTLRPGNHVEITLNFEDGSQQHVTAPIKKIGMMMHRHH